MRLITYILILLFLGCAIKDKESAYFLPAEWEPHQSMIVSFDDDDKSSDSVSVEMVKHLSKEMKVYCMILSDTLIPYYQNWFVKEGIKDSINFIIFGSSFPYSIRDPLFFLKNKEGDLAIASFAWNDYGYSPSDSLAKIKFKKESQQDKNAYQTQFQKTFNYQIISSEMINEGGAIEVNGKGVLIQVEAVNKQRNPNMSLKSQEEELRKILNVSKIIWLKEGAADDPDGKTNITQNYFGIGVNGHVDEICRFSDPKTILLSFPDSADAMKDPVTKITYERMRVNFEILKKSVDQNGNPFTIVKIPVPDLQYKTYVLDSTTSDTDAKRFSQKVFKKFHEFHQGDTVFLVPASSYLNYVVTNKMVLLPKYWKPGMEESQRLKDEQVRQLFERHFPNRKIIQINPTGMNYLGGGMHCWSQQVPK